MKTIAGMCLLFSSSFLAKVPVRLILFKLPKSHMWEVVGVSKLSK